MAYYTITDTVLEEYISNQNPCIMTELLYRFPTEANPHQILLDSKNSNKIMDIYYSYGERSHNIASWLDIAGKVDDAFYRVNVVPNENTTNEEIFVTVTSKINSPTDRNLVVSSKEELIEHELSENGCIICESKSINVLNIQEAIDALKYKTTVIINSVVLGNGVSTGNINNNSNNSSSNE
jgi:hypothetical protein